MSGAMGWIKSNLPIVGMSAAIVVVLPAAWVGSKMWNTSIRKAQEVRADKDLSQLKTANVAYRVDPVVPDAPPIEWSGPPNPRITEFFAKTKEEMEGEAKVVAESAQRTNRGDHRPLIEGLFPTPTGSSLDVKNKAIDMARMIVPSGDPANPTAYERLLKEIGAGGPPEASVVAQVVSDLVESERMRIQAERGSPTLTADEQKQLTEKLIARRIGEYQRRAQEVSVYADISIFPPPKKGMWTGIPTREPDRPAEVEKLFEWQFDYWTFREVLRAVTAANVDAEGERLSASEAPVKRIMTVNVQQLQIYAENALRLSAGDDLTPYSPGEMIPADYTESFTGRRSRAKNHLYDVRMAQVGLVVSSSRVKDVVEAMQRSNFVTVTDVDLRAIDPWSHLRDGYYYGTEHVVEATVTLETVWLRSWTTGLMPGIVRYALGMDVPVEAGGEDDDR